MFSISICTIVKNEELNLHKMLDSIKEIADEIIVVDTGSTDKTIEIAKSYGSIVFDFNWIDDFSSARNFSVSKATKDFIFILDADEVVINAIKIKEQLNKEWYFLYMIKVINPNYEYDLNFNSKIHYTSKIFKNNNLFQYKGCIHEALVPNQNTQVNRTLLKDVEIIHSGYFGENKSDFINKKILRNLKILERELKKYNYDNYYYHLCFLVAQEYIGLNDFNKSIYYLELCLANNDNPDHLIINSLSNLLQIFYKSKQWSYFEYYSDKYKTYILKSPDLCFKMGLYLQTYVKNNRDALFYYYKALNFKLENNLYLNYDLGSNTWKPLYMISIIQMSNNNFIDASNNLEKALKFSSFWQLKYNLILCLSKYDIVKAKVLFDSLFKDNIPIDKINELEKVLA